MNSILGITDPILKDNSIDRYEEFAYEPITGSNLNSPGQDIRINIETQDIFTHPSESYLIIKGRLLKDDGTAYAHANRVALVNNGIMYLFKRIRYDLSGQDIENIMNVGQATTMLGLLKYPDDFSKSKGLNQLWYKDTKNTTILETDNANFNVGFKVRHDYIFGKNNGDVDPIGTFSFRIPLKHIFGFCEDYDKVVYGLKHTLTLTRDNNNTAIFRVENDAAGNPFPNGQVLLSDIIWYMPHVTPADEDKMKLYKIIERKEKIPVGYRMIQCDNAIIPQNSRNFSWRLAVKSSPEVPRFIIIGFQQDGVNKQTTNPSTFAHLNVTNMYVMLNSMRYPVADYNIDFLKNHFSRVYGDVTNFRSKFFNMDELISNPNINPSDYKDLYTLFLFDVSKQSEKLKYSTTDIQVKMSFGRNTPANTQAYAVIISDRLINFQSDGNKFSVVF